MAIRLIGLEYRITYDILTISTPFTIALPLENSYLLLSKISKIIKFAENSTLSFPIASIGSSDTFICLINGVVYSEVSS